MSITVACLDALLSPDPAQRHQAEDFLRAMTVEARAQALLQALDAVQGHHHQQLVAVLLRREILKLSNEALLKSMVDPLMTAFGSTQCTCRSAVGDCLAEVSGMLAITSPSDGLAVILRIIASAGTTVRSWLCFVCDYK